MIESFATIPAPTNHEDVTHLWYNNTNNTKNKKISPESFDDERRLWRDPHPSTESKARCEGQETPVLGASGDGDGDDHREVKQKHFFEHFYVLWMNHHTILCSDASFYTEL